MERDQWRFVGWGAAPGSQLSESGPWSYEMQELELYTLRLDFRALGKTRAHVTTNFRGKGIGYSGSLFAVYLQSANVAVNPVKYPNAESFYTKALSIPSIRL